MTGMASTLALIAAPAERRGFEQAALRTLAYADVFDAPLTMPEVHRYLVAMPAGRAAVEGVLAGLRREGLVSCVDDCWMLAGREDVLLVRRDRERHARRLWPLARRYGRLIGRLPGVRLVGVSGALAVDNVTADADIDYFVVTAAGRLWTTRALVVGVVRLAARAGHTLCPNYLVSERAIALEDRTFFTAHELAQLVPLAGSAMYERLRAWNAWSSAFLPNAGGAPAKPAPGECGSRLARYGERIFGSALGEAVEQWEQRRKVGRFAGASVREARFDAECCKGHFRQHGQRVLNAYTGVLARLGIDQS